MTRGLYEGFYKYDSERIQRSIGREQTFFHIHIIESDGPNFTGSVKEESAGQPGEGIIIGQFDGEKISFVKQMEIAASIVPDGQLKIYNTKHPKIYYNGVFIDNRFKGTWKIKFGFIFDGILPIPIPLTSGSWEMRKK